MRLLVTTAVVKNEIGVLIGAPLAARDDVVGMKLLAIKERVAAHRTCMPLSDAHAFPARAQVFGV